MKKLNAQDLTAYLERHDISGEIVYLDEPTPTVEIAAQAVHTHPENIVKSILFLVKGDPVLAIACGTQRVERRAIAAYYQLSRKKVRLADAATVLEVSGYEVGAMPPFGHHVPLPTLLDERVLTKDELYAGGGDENALLRLSPRDILRVTSAHVLDLHATPTA